MALTTEQVIELARQAKLQVTPEEVERFRVQLGAVLDRMDALREVEQTDMESTPEHGTALRVDEVAPDTPVRDVTDLSENVVSRFFTVPRALPNEAVR